MTLRGRFVVQSIGGLLGIGLLCLAGIVFTTFWLNEASRRHFEETIEARELRSLAIELRGAVQSAESSERGYLLTGNQIYLSPYSTAKTLAERRLEALRSKPSGLVSEAVLTRLTAAVNQKLADLDRVIALKGEGRDADALEIVRTNRGKLLMDEINLFTSGIARIADARQTDVVLEQRTNATRLRLVSIATSILIILVVGGVMALVYRYTREITRARDELDTLNEALEARVAARTAALSRANTEIQQFAHIVSHDLRAPLVNIVGYSSELANSIAEAKLQLTGAAPESDAARAKLIVDEMPEALDFIRSSTRKMDRLINTILKVSREGRRSLHREIVSIMDVISSSQSSLHHQLVEFGGQIDVHLEVDSIVTDRLALEQIIGNLLDNSVKYRSAERPLLINVSSRRLSAEKVSIEVADNGRGIADRDLHRVFELFQRAGHSDQPGEGVGLAYVQVLVRNLGGEISLVSQLDKGTTVRLVLPETGDQGEQSHGA